MLLEIIGVVAFLVLVISLLIGISVGMAERELAKARKKLAAIPCPTCQVAFGEKVTLKAEQNWLNFARALRQLEPGVKHRLIARWRIECPGCGWTGDFLPSTSGKLEPPQ